MKKINKVIAATMIMAITAAMPAMAVNKKNVGYDKRAKVVVVLDERGPHHYRHHAYGHHPDMRVCAFRVSHHSSPRHMVAKAERIHGGHTWALDTILEEPANCHLYEKLGYHRTGTPQRVRPNMTLIDYEKD